MAIADTITSMQTHTSNAYTMIGYGTDLTGINKNLQNLSSTIFEAFLESLKNPDTLFTNLPKKSGTGANITLNDTANAPMRITLGATELTQASTPTPSSPQDIHTINGSNTIKVEGKNLFDGINKGIFLNWAVDVCGANVGDSGSYIKVNGGNYTISTTGTQERYRVACVMNEPSSTTQTAYRGTRKDGTSDSVVIDTTGYNYLVINATDLTKIQIEVGSTATTYTPYVSQEADIDLTTYTNLFNQKAFEEQLVSGKILDNSGNEVSDGSSTYSKYKIPVKANIPIHIKGAFQRTYYYDANGNFVSRSGASNTEIDTTYTPTTNGYIGFQIINTYWTSNKGQEMINYGTTALPYVPYADIEYCKIGDYEDRIFKNVSGDTDYSSEREDGAWYIKKNIGKVVLDGTETWTFASAGRYITSQAITNGITSSNTIILMSNYFKGIAYDERNNISYASIYLQNNYLGVNNSGFTSESELQTWLTTHNTSVYYVLATPTYTQITGTLANQLENVYQKMLSYEGQTNISQINNDLPFELNVSAIEG